MNCEKCKSKKATLFYADEGGVKHALCASCGEGINKISELCEKNQAPRSKLIPEKVLYSFYERPSAISPYICREVGRDVVCPNCKTALEDIIKSGRFICPDCYESFGDYLSVCRGSSECEEGARMPSARRSDIDRRRALERLKTEIKLAVENENYELAASLRDKVRRLEASV